MIGSWIFDTDERFPRAFEQFRSFPFYSIFIQRSNVSCIWECLELIVRMVILTCEEHVTNKDLVWSLSFP